jgi:hypothetical protein
LRCLTEAAESRLLEHRAQLRLAGLRPESEPYFLRESELGVQSRLTLCTRSAAIGLAAAHAHLWSQRKLSKYRAFC